MKIDSLSLYTHPNKIDKKNTYSRTRAVGEREIVHSHHGLAVVRVGHAHLPLDKETHGGVGDEVGVSLLQESPLGDANLVGEFDERRDLAREDDLGDGRKWRVGKLTYGRQ